MKKVKNLSPRAGAQSHKEFIHWSSFDTDLGTVLLAAGQGGICFIEFGSSAAALERRMRAAFKDKEFMPFDAARQAQLMEWQSILQNYINGASQDLSGLPMDMAGTDFQKQVWKALQAIPRGKTWPYKKIAQAIGHPSATRAVANACGRNRLALVVPCHRAVRADGGLGGFRWGLDLKRKLIALEAR